MGSAVGAELIEGTFVVGDIVGTLDVDGTLLVEGTFVGTCEGLIEDCSEGLIEGCVESEAEGIIEALIDGTSLGFKVGKPVSVGLKEGG